VEIKEFTENQEGKNHISALIHVERDSQKPIIIGKGGAAIAKLRLVAQTRINEFLKKNYRLELRVAVTPQWRQNAKTLKQFGF
jgi:GTP-binding protein Era